MESTRKSARIALKQLATQTTKNDAKVPVEQPAKKPASIKKKVKRTVDAIVPIETSGPGTTFTIFKKLPAELQLAVWSFALPDPQLISIEEDNTVPFYSLEPHLIATYKIPALLYACHDSREAALQVYRLSFTNDLRNPIYVDFVRDTLVLRDHFDQEFIEEFLHGTFEFSTNSGHSVTDRAFIRHLAVASTIWLFATSYDLVQFSNLQTLVLCTVDDCPQSKALILRHLLGTYKAEKMKQDPTLTEADIKPPAISFMNHEEWDATYSPISAGDLA